MHKFFAKTQFIGKKVLLLPQCHSTNDIATGLIAQGIQIEGTTIIAENQTRGKGQRGNVWESKPGKNITFSLILKPSQIPVSHQFNLHIITTLAVHAVLFPILGKKLSIKWPNDIYYSDKKIGGILIENNLRGNKIEYSVIGTGINVNQIQFQNKRATSIREITNKEFILNELIENILIQFENKYIRLNHSGVNTLKQEYHCRLYQFKEKKKYQTAGRTFSGVILGVSDTGKLEIQENESVHSFDFKEVIFL